MESSKWISLSYSELDAEDKGDKEARHWRKEINDMLLAGGYFRARISTLSTFDRIIGGLAWCITAASEDVGTQILFQEDSHMKQKIKLAEPICDALRRMKCPFSLSPHQIQGLDSASIFLVIKWCVKKVLERRVEFGDQIRAMSVDQFGKYFGRFPDETIQKISPSEKPKRKYRKIPNHTFETLDAHVDATLLEYGEKVYRTFPELSSTKKEGKYSQFENNLSKGKNTHIEEEKKEEKRIDIIKQQLAATTIDLSGKNVGSLVGLRVSEIERVRDEYEAERAKEIEEEDKIKNLAKAEETAHKKQIEALQRRHESLVNVLNKLSDEHKNKKSILDSSESDLKNQIDIHDNLLSEYDKIQQQLENHENHQHIPCLRSLVIMREKLKKHEKEFKKNCKNELARFKNMIENVKTSLSSDIIFKKNKELDDIHARDTAKILAQRQILSDKDKEIITIERDIDQIPTRNELLAYETRFIELYRLMADKLIEIKNFYSVYNTLTDTNEILTKEVSLLESISSHFTKSFLSETGKDSFNHSFERILKDVDENLHKLDISYQLEKKTLDNLIVDYTTIVEKQRTYFKQVKEYENACLECERLQGEVQRLESLEIQ